MTQKNKKGCICKSFTASLSQRLSFHIFFGRNEGRADVEWKSGIMHCVTEPASAPVLQMPYGRGLNNLFLLIVLKLKFKTGYKMLRFDAHGIYLINWLSNSSPHV
jgi:hypothetical protein